MIEATKQPAFDDEEHRVATLESDSLAPARGLVFASVLSAAIYCAAWLVLSD